MILAKITGVIKLARVITIEGRYNIKRFSPKIILSISYEDNKTGQEKNTESCLTDELILKELNLHVLGRTLSTYTVLYVGYTSIKLGGSFNYTCSLANKIKHTVFAGV